MNNCDFGKSSTFVASNLYDVCDPNSVCSPLSIAFVLALLQCGSNGNTRNEFNKFFGCEHSMDELTKMCHLFNSDIVRLANTIMVNNNCPLKSSYMNMVKTLASVSNEDFSDREGTATKANAFIETNTRGLIKGVIDPSMITSDLVAMLINAIHFKAPWLNQFETFNTRKELFDNKFNVDMMMQTDYFPYFEDSNVQLLEMNYQNRDFCMGFILPKKNQPHLKGQLMNYLTVQKMGSQFVEVHVPKFTQRKKMILNDTLKMMGLIDAFSEGRANFSNMSDMRIFISEVIHEAVVIVDENGTEAAAVTVASMCFESCCVRKDPVPIIFNANRPFTYYIKHCPTNTIMFVASYCGSGC